MSPGGPGPEKTKLRSVAGSILSVFQRRSVVSRIAKEIADRNHETNLLLTVSQLPIEVLGEIFMLAIIRPSFNFEDSLTIKNGITYFQEDSIYNSLRALRFAHVCRLWRFAVSSHRELLSHLGNEFAVDRANLHLLALASARVNPVLHVYWTPCDADYPRQNDGQTDRDEMQTNTSIPRSNAFLGTIVKHSSQIGSLRITDTEFQGCRLLGFGLLHCPMPSLHTLYIRSTSSHSGILASDLFQGQTPNLRELTLIEMKIIPSSSFIFHNLTHLNLSSIPAGDHYQISEILHILETCPKLRVLRLINAGPRTRRINSAALDPSFVKSGRLLDLPLLHTLHLVLGESNPLDYFSVVNFITTPSLRNFVTGHVGRASKNTAYILPTNVRPVRTSAAKEVVISYPLVLFTKVYYESDDPFSFYYRPTEFEEEDGGYSSFEKRVYGRHDALCDFLRNLLTDWELMTVRKLVIVADRYTVYDNILDDEIYEYTPIQHFYRSTLPFFSHIRSLTFKATWRFRGQSFGWDFLRGLLSFQNDSPDFLYLPELEELVLYGVNMGPFLGLQYGPHAKNASAIADDKSPIELLCEFLDFRKAKGVALKKLAVISCFGITREHIEKFVVQYVEDIDFVPADDRYTYMYTSTKTSRLYLPPNVYDDSF